ncbi:MAG: CusA/CzcA family heavy metal efflux RND transporter [Bacteroidetes bacterium]|nr:CusA/CzcA family heavy metal efflux RND transporter [Bacteroidota bacterium]MBS1541060.1 CusA/CzcA family heavy metal efflux RND transporter [Bacteroidota bacterium]
MIDKLIFFSVKNKLLIATLVLAMSIGGGLSLLRLPIDAVPDVTGNQVDVITSSQSLAALEIERFITAPLEMAMSNIPGLVEIRSTSKFGLSVARLVFDDDTDVYWARQQVFERLEAVKSEIPQELGKPFMGPVSTGLGEVFQYVIRPQDPNDKSYSLMEIRTLQDWTIRKQLLGVKGVAEVSGFGGFKKEYQATLIPDRMRALGVTIDELFNALSTGNSNTGGAYIEKENKAFTIRGIGLATSLAEIGNTVIKVNNRIPILVKDVADINLGHSIRYGAMTVDGTGETVGGVIMMVKGENGSRVIARIKDKMKEIQAALPEGLIIEPFIDRAKIVKNSITTVATNLVEGALIVVLVILVFLGNWRASLLAASVIPLSMLFAFILMKQFNVAGNLMSLGAIDFGLLVDPSIIVVESAVFFLAYEMKKRMTGEAYSQTEKEKIVIEATQAVKKSVVYGGLIILIVYFPILTLSGIEGKMFGPMAKTVSFAILGAIILSLTYVPMMAALILKPSAHHGHGISERIVRFIFSWYKPIIQASLNNRKSILIISAVILLSGMIGFKFIGGEFIPKLAEGDLVIETNLPVGTSMTETINFSNRMQKLLLETYPDEIHRVVSKIGTSEVPIDPVPMESQDIVITLTDRKQWTKAKDQEELMAQIGKLFQRYPGILYSIQQPIENRVNELMSGARTDVVVKLFGPHLDSLVSKGNQIIKIIKTIPGATEVQEKKIFGLPQINIKYDRRAMATYGVTVAQVNRAIQTTFAGSVAGIIYENDKRFDLTLRLAGDERAKAENIRNLTINDKDDDPIPLKELADISEEIGPSEISHENLQRKLNIGFNVRGRDLESVVNDAIKKIEAEVILPSGYSIDFGGEFENFRRAKDRLAIVVPVSLVVIFGLLFATFGNTKDSLLIYSVVPLSAVGGVFSLLLRGMNFSISAGVGFIALFGIAVLNGILIISRFNELEKNSVNDIHERVIQGLNDRFRPVLMTSAVAALGFLPMALSSSTGAEVQKPLATVVIGGLFSATILTLIVLPVIYTYFAKRPKINIGSGVTLTIVLFFLSSFAQAQQSYRHKPVSLDSAVKIAKFKNPEMTLAQKRIDQQVSLKPASFSLQHPDLLFEAPTGQELRPGILQVIDYPGVFVAQSRAQKNKIEMTEAEKSIATNSLVYRVQTSYNLLQYLIMKTKILQNQDSVFDDINQVNEIRYRVGQISALEKLNGESQYKRILYNWKISKAELRNAKYQFNLLLGNPNDTLYVPNEEMKKNMHLLAASPVDTTHIAGNPMLKYSHLQETYSLNYLKIERRKRIPGSFIGFLNQGTPEAALMPRIRFGFTLPIWQWTFQANINAAKKGVEIARAQKQLTRYQLNTEYAKAQTEFRQHQDNLHYFETIGLAEANEIFRASRESFRLGSINYYQFIQNLELSYSLRQDYIETLKNYNQAIINLIYLKGEY